MHDYRFYMEHIPSQTPMGILCARITATAIAARAPSRIAPSSSLMSYPEGVAPFPVSGFLHSLAVLAYAALPLLWAFPYMKGRSPSVPYAPPYVLLRGFGFAWRLEPFPSPPLGPRR